MPNALITGVTGQDGSYLAEFLLEKGYEVWGLIPHRHAPHFENIQWALEDVNFHLVDGDMTDASSLVRAVRQSDPNEVYNLAAQSFVQRSWDVPALTMDVNSKGLLNLLEACRYHAMSSVRIYQASSSEIFGASSSPQSESTSLDPRSPYAVSKASAHMMAINYRKSFGMFVSCGILFNHESERRGENFVTQKVCKAAADIKNGKQKVLFIGDTRPFRDWGYAPDYVEAMWLMLQHDKPDDFVIGTGHSHSVQALINHAFNYVGIPTNLVRQDEKFMRPCDVPFLQADPLKARNVLGWEPKVQFHELVERMVDRWLKTPSCSTDTGTVTGPTSEPATTNDE